MTSNKFTQSQTEPAADQPSKSQRRREALAVLELANELASLKKSALLKLPLSSATTEALLAVTQIKARVARKRQLHFAAKCLRQEDLEAVQAQLEGPAPGQSRAAQLERWADYLLAHGLSAVEALISAVPGANRQTVRQAILSVQRLSEEKKQRSGRQAILKSLAHLGEVDVPPPPGN